MLGFLRETEELAAKAGIDKEFNIPRTGLDTYLKIIFPDAVWFHDTALKEHGFNDKDIKNKRPDYYSPELNLIVEFLGVQHYTSPHAIASDVSRVHALENRGFTVVSIPYFIQLSNKVVLRLFGVDVQQPLFDESIPSLGLLSRATPGCLCSAGINRMATEFARYSPEQYKVNIEYLNSVDAELKYLTGAKDLQYYYEAYVGKVISESYFNTLVTTKATLYNNNVVPVTFEDWKHVVHNYYYKNDYIDRCINSWGKGYAPPYSIENEVREVVMKWIKSWIPENSDAPEYAYVYDFYDAEWGWLEGYNGALSSSELASKYTKESHIDFWKNTFKKAIINDLKLRVQ